MIYNDKRPHISGYLRNDAALSEKLPILPAALRFVALYAVNPRENSYKPLLLRNNSSLATFLALTVKAYRYVTQARMVSSASHNTRTPGVSSGTRTFRWIGHSRSFKVILNGVSRSRTRSCRNNVDLISKTYEDIASGKPQIRRFQSPHPVDDSSVKKLSTI